MVLIIWIIGSELSIIYTFARFLDAVATTHGDQRVRRALIVSLDETPRQLAGGIEVWPWQLFCQRLWEGDLV